MQKEILRDFPGRLKHADRATLTLLPRQSDPELRLAAGSLLEALRARQPEDPAVLETAIRYHEGLGQADRALDARRFLARLEGYEDDARKREAALWMGRPLGRDDPDLAYAYLWDAMTWWFKSGSGGDFGDRDRRALDELKASRSGTRPAPAIEDRRPR